VTGGGQLRLPVSLLHGSLVISEDWFTVNARAEKESKMLWSSLITAVPTVHNCNLRY
jgi:hypothetical protein